MVMGKFLLYTSSFFRKRRNREVANPLKINECGGKRSGPGQPIVAGPQGAADNVNKETT